MRIPAEIESRMKLWRDGLIGLPSEYIQWHREQAEATLPEIEKDYRIVEKRMSDDGWMDGMQFLELIIEDRHSKAVTKVKWSDSCRWYQHSWGGGWTLTSLAWTGPDPDMNEF